MTANTWLANGERLKGAEKTDRHLRHLQHRTAAQRTATRTRAVIGGAM